MFGGDRVEGGAGAREEEDVRGASIRNSQTIASTSSFSLAETIAACKMVLYKKYTGLVAVFASEHRKKQVWDGRRQGQERRITELALTLRSV